MSYRSQGYNFKTSPSGLVIPVVADPGDVDDYTDVSFDIDFPGGTTDFLRADGTFAAPSGSAHVIEDEGTPLTQRADLNFVGAGVTAADSGGKTVVTIAGAGAATYSKLYDYTVAGTDKASIDTNVDGTTVANFAGFDILEVHLVARTDDAGATANPTMIVNNDTGAKYDRQVVSGTNVTAAAAVANAAASWTLTVHGNGGLASQASSVMITIPNYAGTTFNKSGHMVESITDSTAGNNSERLSALGFRDTAAITRVKVAAAGAAKFKIGTRLIVIGR